LAGVGSKPIKSAVVHVRQDLGCMGGSDICQEILILSSEIRSQHYNNLNHIE